jgi:hypothetical protein
MSLSAERTSAGKLASSQLRNGFGNPEPLYDRNQNKNMLEIKKEPSSDIEVFVEDSPIAGIHFSEALLTPVTSFQHELVILPSLFVKTLLSLKTKNKQKNALKTTWPNTISSSFTPSMVPLRFCSRSE